MKKTSRKSSIAWADIVNLRNYWFFKVIVCLLLIILVLVGVLFILPGILSPKLVKDDEVYGIAVQDQVWERTIRVTGDFWVVPGAKVTIRPGTKVEILRSGDRSNFDLLPWHLKNGVNIGVEEYGIEKGEPFWDEKEKIQLHFFNLDALGTKNNPIVVTSDSSPGSPYDINLITVSKGILSYVELSNYRRLEIGEKVTVQNSSFTNTGDCALCVEFGEQLIKDNTFKKGRKYYLNVGMASPEIIGNKFLESEGDGIIFWGDNFANVKVEGNFFHMPGKKAVRVIPLDEGGIITKNIFSVGDIELPCNSKVGLVQNSIQVQVVFKQLTDCVGEYVVGKNFWNIQDINSVIPARIVGITRDFKVKIPSILTTPPLDMGNNE